MSQSNGEFKPKIDKWMPFHGLEFFEAVKAYPDYILIGYLKALWHYWHHEHAGGLPNNSEMRRKICGIEKSDWIEAESIIFDGEKFFYQSEDLKWHQRRAFDEHAERMKVAIMNHNKTKAANNAIHGRKWGWRKQLND